MVVLCIIMYKYMSTFMGVEFTLGLACLKRIVLAYLLSYNNYFISWNAKLMVPVTVCARVCYSKLYS